MGHQNSQEVTLTLKHRETHGCLFKTVATDALVVKHQAISIHSVDKYLLYLSAFTPQYLILNERHEKVELHFEKKNTQWFKGKYR